MDYGESRRWAWLLAMILIGLGMVIDLASYVRGSVLHIPMIINVVMVFYLNQRDVRRVFEDLPSTPSQPKGGLD